MDGQINDPVRSYLNMDYALRTAGETNSKNLSRKEIEYLLVIGAYPNVEFTESRLKAVFEHSSATASDSVRALTEAGLVKKELRPSGSTRGARIIMTSEGSTAYKAIRAGLESAVKEDIVGRNRTIF